MLSVLVPVYNEEGAIEKTVRGIHAALKVLDEQWEIVVIDDGSTDKTPAILERLKLPHVRAFTHPENLGNGASIKTGIRRASGDILCTVDADGTYPLHEIPRLLQEMRKSDADMVVGSRPRRCRTVPVPHVWAKMILIMLAEYLTGIAIPDINSGLRMFRRPLVERFMGLYPQGFSFHITLTLASLTNGYLVRFLPIGYAKRIGQSKLSTGLSGIGNFLRFCHIVLRIVSYFRPLRFFLWPAGFLGLLGILGLTSSAWTGGGLGLLSAGLLFAALQIGLCGVIAEILVRTRAENAFAEETAADILRP